MSRKLDRVERRKKRVRSSFVLSTRKGIPRLSVYRSNMHIYAQLIDDSKGITIKSVSTLNESVRTKVSRFGNKNAAEEVGRQLARDLFGLGIKKVIFDRGPYLYHGRVKSLAEGARAEGLIF